jgi:hypothetical protein
LLFKVDDVHHASPGPKLLEMALCRWPKEKEENFAFFFFAVRSVGRDRVTLSVGRFGGRVRSVGQGRCRACYRVCALSLSLTLLWCVPVANLSTFPFFFFVFLFRPRPNVPSLSAAEIWILAGEIRG